MKAENKKLVALLKDSEKLFYQKIKETRKESENLNAVFKQVWPLIKHKVKDPGGLLKTIGISDLGDGTSVNPGSSGIANFLQPNEGDALRLELEQVKQSLAQRQEELNIERENRQILEIAFSQQQNYVEEMRAFQSTVQTFTKTTTSSTLAPKRLPQK